MNYLIDPRPLDPPSYWDNDSEPNLIPYWHLIATDGHEDYASSSTEAEEITRLYLDAGVPFTVQLLHREHD